MDRYLKSGMKIELEGIDGSFIIGDIIGRGASCVVYHTNFCNKNGKRSEHLLKEYNPKHLELKRDDMGEILIKKQDTETFELGLKKFEESYEKHSWLRKQCEIKNYTANIHNFYYGNGTAYIDMSVTEGVSYAYVQEKSLYNLARRIKVLAEIIEKYHRNGFLYLDLKPSNIYVRPENETCEDMLLFDFDSILEKKQINLVKSLSYTDEWAALEVTSEHRRHLICEATDIFSIGEIFFEKLMGRHSESWERRTFSKYDYDFETSILKDVNPHIKVYLDELFHNSLCNTVSERFQTMEELITLLDEIVKISYPYKPYIINNCPKPQECFVGRENEIKTINELLKTNQTLFINGIGGIGKSELVKNYAKQYIDNYDAVVFVPYKDNFKMMLSNDMIFPIAHFAKYEDENFENYASRKWKMFKQLCNSRILIIIDNLNDEDDEMLGDLLQLNCQLLITTRNDFSNYGFMQYTLERISDSNKIFEVFERYYVKPISADEKECVMNIIENIHGHTMTVELIAKQMMAGRISTDQMLQTILEKGVNSYNNEKVLINKDNLFKKASVHTHIQTLFDLSEMTEMEKNILLNLSLIPYTGIQTELFYMWSELKTYNLINQLIFEGWVKFDEQKDYISMHPVIAEVVISNLVQSIENEITILDNCVDYLAKTPVNKLKMDYVELYELMLYVSKMLVRLNILTLSAARFLKSASTLFVRVGHIEDAIFNAETALNIYLNYFPNKKDEIGSTHNRLGRLYLKSSNYEKCLEHHFRAYDIWLEEYGKDSRRIVSSLLNIGIVYLTIRKFRLAEKYFLEALQICELEGEDTHPSLSNVKNCLGVLYGDIEKYELAEKYLIEALNIRLKKFGRKHFRSIETYSNLGAFYHKIKDLEKAKIYYEEAYYVAEDMYGKENSVVVTLCNNLGRLCILENKLAHAENYLKKGWETCIKLYGIESRDYMLLASGLGWLYECQNQCDLAEEYYVRALRWVYIKYGEVEGEKTADIKAIFAGLKKVWTRKFPSITEKEYLNYCKGLAKKYSNSNIKMLEIQNDVF